MVSLGMHLSFAQDRASSVEVKKEKALPHKAAEPNPLQCITCLWSDPNQRNPPVPC